jgi:hypothetical protein
MLTATGTAIVAITEIKLLLKMVKVELHEQQNCCN